MSAFAPIVAPSRVPWGEKAFANYLGSDRERWREWDAIELVRTRKFPGPILIDQGTGDKFLQEQLLPERFAEACRKSNTSLQLNYRDGYDHGYYFISTFMADHLQFHAQRLH